VFRVPAFAGVSTWLAPASCVSRPHHRGFDAECRLASRMVLAMDSCPDSPGGPRSHHASHFAWRGAGGAFERPAPLRILGWYVLPRMPAPCWHGWSPQPDSRLRRGPIEVICDVPLGQLAWKAALARDLPLLVVLTLLVAIVIQCRMLRLLWFPHSARPAV